MMWLWLSWAMAQEPDIGVVPDLVVDVARASVDAQHAVYTEDARIGVRQLARLDVGYARDPLRFETDAGERIRVVGDITTVTASLAHAFGPVRLGLSGPLILGATSDLEDRGAPLLGDIALDAKVELWAVDAAAVSVLGRALLPMGASTQQLGAPRPGWELGVAGEWTDGTWWLGGNLGTRGVPEVELATVDLGDVWWYRGGVGFSPTEPVQFAVEAVGQTPWRSLGASTASPVELVASGHWRFRDDARVRLGCGKGLNLGIGNPVYRLLVGIEVHERVP